MSTSDFNAEEEGFRTQFEPTLRGVRATAGHCPDPDLLMAAGSAFSHAPKPSNATLRFARFVSS